MQAAQTDEQLLAEFVAGRRTALAELARRYERPLLGLAAGLLRQRRDLACDAVQETWLRVLRFAKHYQGRSRFKTWLYRIGINQCRTLQASLTAGPPTDPSVADPPVDSPPDTPVRVADENHTVRAAVARLDPDKQLVILLCYHSGVTHEHAAEILELPLGTLKSRLHAALTELRAALATEATP